MFPIRDHNPAERTPFVTYALIAVNILVYLAMLPTYGDEQALYGVFYRWGLVPDWIMHGEQYQTLLTHMFLHGGFMHLAGNMLFLWIFGDNLEDELGHVGFLLFYLASGLGAAALQIYFGPDSQAPMVGASGAIAGIMGGYLLLFPKARVDVLFIFIVFFKIFPVPAWLMLIVWFGLQLFNGVASIAGGSEVAYWAHAGGFIVGLVWVLPFWLRQGGPDFWARTRGHPPHPEAKYRLSESPIPRVRRRR
ncbi:MAG TPA: rhomboid family intramembrane serine protease [Aliiroseovarius sp.]|nr:rhomboid family intramembrane serine protease [Aliiroseovarius sp.]